MTTWQNQQPMSRRALRDSERAQAQATLSDTGEQPPVETPFDQQIFERPAPTPPVTPPRPSREPLENHDRETEPLRRPRNSGAVRPESNSPAYRLRDFSPEARGNSFSSTQTAPWTPPSPGSEDLDYHTSVDANRSAPQSYSRPVASPPIVVTPEEASNSRTEPDVPPTRESVERTLTRRELREMRNRTAPSESEPAFVDAAAPPVAPAVPAMPVAVAPAPVPDSASAGPKDELAEAMAAFDRLYEHPQTPPPLVEPVLATPVTPTPAPVSAPAETSAIPPAPAQSPSEPLREVVTAPEVFSAPVDHWSHGNTIDAPSDASVGPHQRDISSSDAITTSALVLPNFPISSPITGPVSGTGEILMTGSVSLPASLGVNGLHPSRYDRSDIDSIIDAEDREDSAPDSAPVRAVRAVSTYTSPNGLLSTKRPKGNNLPMVLSITAGVMMVGVVVLVIAGMIFKIF